MEPHVLGDVSDFASRLRDFHSQFANGTDPADSAEAHTNDKVDAVLSEWALLAALALEKLNRSTRAFKMHWNASSLDRERPSSVPNTGTVLNANRNIVLNQLSVTDCLALEMLQRLSQMPPAQDTWTQRSGLAGENAEPKAVSPKRKAQIDAFEKIMSDVRSSHTFKERVFRHLETERKDAEAGYPR